MKRKYVQSMFSVYYKLLVLLLFLGESKPSSLHDHKQLTVVALKINVDLQPCLYFKHLGSNFEIIFTVKVRFDQLIGC